MRRRPGSAAWTIADCVQRGIVGLVEEALARLGHVEAILVDFDIDVIDRAQCPGAPGARPGGLPAQDFFARRPPARRPRPASAWSISPSSIRSLDVADITALTAGRWLCEVLAGYTMRR